MFKSRIVAKAWVEIEITDTNTVIHTCLYDAKQCSDFREEVREVLADIDRIWPEEGIDE
jgi:hypothetical protein